MRRTGALLMLLTLIATAATTRAAVTVTATAPTELTPVVRENSIGLRIRATAWPATLTKDLLSGLTNTLLIHVALCLDAKPLHEKTAVITIQYDLWEETFAVTEAVDGVVVSTRTAGSTRQIEALLADLEIPNLFSTSAIPRERMLTLRAEMLLNPIDRERLEAIKKWVIQNDTSIPADTSGFNDKHVGNSRSNEVFNKIFEQYAWGVDAAASWKESLSSKPFKITITEVAR